MKLNLEDFESNLVPRDKSISVQERFSWADKIKNEQSDLMLLVSSPAILSGLMHDLTLRTGVYLIKL